MNKLKPITKRAAAIIRHRARYEAIHGKGSYRVELDTSLPVVTKKKPPNNIYPKGW